MELDAVAEHEARRIERFDVRVIREQAVKRGDAKLLRKRERRRNQPDAMLGGAHEQARTAHGRERHRAEELRVVVEPVPVIRVRPGPVEDILAVGMAFQVQRHGGPERAVLPEQNELRPPAFGGHRAVRLVQRVQKRVPEERIVAGEGVPRGRLDGRNRRHHLQRFKGMCRRFSGRGSNESRHGLVYYQQELSAPESGSVPSNVRNAKRIGPVFRVSRSVLSATRPVPPGAYAMLNACFKGITAGTDEKDRGDIQAVQA